MKYIGLIREKISGCIAKLQENIYGAIILVICMLVITGYISTIVTSEEIRECFVGIAIIGLIMGTGAVIISLIEAKKHQKPLVVILNLLLIVVVYTSVFCSIYIYDNSSFELPKQGVVYLDFLYFSFVTFTTTGYGDITPVSYLAKFTSASEAFIFACVISIAILNFSNSLISYIRDDENRQGKG
jgi:hypothetical protein